MEVYLIRKKDVERYGIEKENLERAFDYITFEDIKEEFNNAGDDISNERLEFYCNLLLTKYNSSHIEDIMEFLERKTSI